MIIDEVLAANADRKPVVLATGHIVFWDEDGETFVSDGTNHVAIGLRGEVRQSHLLIGIEILRTAGAETKQ